MMNSIRHTLLSTVIILAVINLRCTLEDSSIIEPTTESLFIRSINVSPDTINTDSIFVNGGQTPADDIHLASVVAVKANRFKSQVNITCDVATFKDHAQIESATLNDDGISPDQFAGDSIYTGTVAYSIKRSYYGRLILSAQGSNPVATSTTIATSITITRNNTPPVVDSVHAPDTLIVQSFSQLLDVKAFVRDQDGSQDIRQVFFTSYLLSDTTTVSPPIQLYDDGGANRANGNTDEVPGDGAYTITLQINPGAGKGTRRFRFQSIDGANALSNIFIYDIVIQ